MFQLYPKEGAAEKYAERTAEVAYYLPVLRDHIHQLETIGAFQSFKTSGRSRQRSHTTGSTVSHLGGLELDEWFAV